MSSKTTMPVDDESVDGTQTQREQPARSEQKKSKKGRGNPLYACLALVVVLAAAVACVVHVITVTADDNDAAKEETTAEQATFILQDLRNVTDWEQPHHDQYDHCFDTFDKDGDGQLNQEEFATYFALELDHSSTFEAIDADDDKILSFAEVVAYMHAMHSIPEIAVLLQQNTGPLVADNYDFSLPDESSISDAELQDFLQYVAVTVFFDNFDQDSHGYIRHEEYLSVSATNEFFAVDEDGDGYVSRAEFFDLLFGHDDYSWDGHLTATFGEDQHQVLEQTAGIQVTPEMVQNVNVTICPMALDKNEGTVSEARRLIYCYFPICWWCNDVGCLWLVPCCF